LPFEPVAVFSGNADAEDGSLPSEGGLREAIAHKEIYVSDAVSNWRLLAEDEDEAEFVHGRLAGTLAWASFKLTDGRWKSSGGSSDCEPTSIVGNGPVVTWSVAQPNGSTPSGVVRRLKVNLGPGPCSSGLPQNPRARLVFEKWGRKLLMTIWLKPLPEGFYDCIGISEPPLKVTLPRKIRLDHLFDGSTYPPRPAIPLGSRAG